ncbi:MAG: VWA domain-containing protein [Planctomycetota bacterium]
MPAFMNPWFFLLALSIPLWLWGRRTFLKPASIGFSSKELILTVAGRARARLLFVPAGLQAAGLLLLVASLARPVAVEKDVTLFTEGMDIFLCLDLSSSMSERVLSADRSNVEVAREVVKDFVASREHDRMGLISFARYPELICPLTTDREALCGFIDRLDTVPQGAEKDGTAWGAALAEAARRFGESGESGEESRIRDPQPPRERVVVLLTDGEENQRLIDPLAAANLCADLRIRVYPISAAGAVNLEKQAIAGLTFPRQGLEDAARITGGIFSRALTGEDLAQVYQEIDSLEKKPIEQKHLLRKRDLYPWFLLPSMALIFLAFVLDRTVFLRIP